jgi:hypothetical protein
VWRVLVVSVAIVAAGAGLAHAASPLGRWIGTARDAREPGSPRSAYPTGKLTVGLTKVIAEFTGRTQAAHDDPNAKSTCRMAYGFTKADAGWRIYRQRGRMQIVGPSTGGPPDLSPCFSLTGNALRVRRAGSKLKAEFTDFYRTDEPFTASLAGYYRR